MALPQGLTVTPVPQVSASGSSPAPTSSIPTFVPPNVAFHNMAFATATGNTMPQPQPAMQPVPQVSSTGSIPASTSSIPTKPQMPPPNMPPPAKELPDYYGILQVEKTATWDEIRRSYRKLALKWHPDKNMHQQELADGEFQKIAEAYEVLSDDEMRKIYDQGGSLAEACCKRKFQQSNEVGEDDDDVEEANFFRDPSDMYAEAFGFGAGACVAGCCGGGQGFDPFAQFRRYGIIPNGEPHDHDHDHDHGHHHHHDDDTDDYDSEDYDSDDYEDVSDNQSEKGDPGDGEDTKDGEDANKRKTEDEDDGEPQAKKQKV